MARLSILIVLLCCVIQNKALGQIPVNVTVNISGLVTGDGNRPLQGASLELMNAADSLLVKTAVSDSSGRYRFTGVNRGAYLVFASATGYEKVYQPVNDASHALNEISIATFQLKTTTNTLKDVIVTAKKPFIELKLDKIVVNVEDNLLSASSSALEVLQKSPGISIDDKGLISLNGKQGVSVMINGRVTYLSQQQLNTMLKGMPAESIAQVEIIANPSAKYDAAGTGGIINIKLKKIVKSGFNGTAYAMQVQGRYAQLSGGTNLSYMAGKFNFFASYNGNFSKYWTISTAKTIFYNNNKQVQDILGRDADGSFSSRSNNMQAGATYVIDKKSNINFLLGKVWNRYNTWDIKSVNSFYMPAKSVDSFSVSHTSADAAFKSILYDINYNLSLDSTGKEFSASIDYSKFSLPEKQFFSTGYFNGDSTASRPGILSRNNQPINISIKSLKADYTQPLTSSEKIEAGIKISIVNTDNIVDYEDGMNGLWVPNTKMSNHFAYTENINAAYVNFSGEYKKGWMIQAGLRAEQTTSKANQLTTDSLFSRKYFQLFPNMVIQKKLGKSQSISVSYSRRIDRPDYENLNPFLYFIDAFNYQKGNSYLQPQLTNSVVVTHMYKSKIISSLNYSYTKGPVVNVNTLNDATHITYQSPENLGSLSHWGLSVSMPVKITSWFTSNNSVNIFYNKYNGNIGDNVLDNGRLTSYINTTNTIMLPVNIRLEVSGFYQSSQQSGPFIIKPVYNVSTALQRSFCKNALSVRLAVNDIFNSWRSRSVLNLGNIDAAYETRWMSRTLNLSVNCNFGNARAKNYRKSNGIQDERNRINK